MKLAHYAALALAVAPLVACADDQKPVVAPRGGTAQPTASAAATGAPTSASAGGQKPDDDPSRSQINISEEIRKACGIGNDQAFFAFDSANVRAQDKSLLETLARCFTSGALKGREMRLVGHADPRGDSEYNMVLGQRRADSVKSVIVSVGMTADKANTTSRGAMDATGTDEAGWTRDRRVDVVLGD